MGWRERYNAVASRGYGKDDVNLVMSDETRKTHFGERGNTRTELGTKAAEGAGVGGAIGGTIGAVAGAVAAGGTGMAHAAVGRSLAIPGLGRVIAGPLAAAIAGAGAGGAAGGLVGALIGWGIPEERVKRYESGIKGGGILMGVKARSDEDATYLQDAWKRSKGTEIYA